MAKQPETIDHFQIVATVTTEQLGLVMAGLLKLGVAPEQVQSQLVTSVLNFKKKVTHDVSAVKFLREWIKDHPTFTREEVGEMFKANDRSDGSSYAALQRLREDGTITGDGHGNYVRKGAMIEGPTKETKQLNKKGKPLQRRPNPTSHYAVPNDTLLLKKMQGRKSITMKEMEQHFEAKGRPRKSVAPIFTRLVAAHKIRRLEQGVYALVVKKVKLTPRTPPAKLNGSAAHAPEVSNEETVTNG